MMTHPVLARQPLTTTERDLFTDAPAAHRAAYRDFLRWQRTESAQRLAALAWG